jgi:hypothetical protein
MTDMDDTDIDTDMTGRKPVVTDKGTSTVVEGDRLRLRSRFRK